VVAVSLGLAVSDFCCDPEGAGFESPRGDQKKGEKRGAK
jgi:hypothetical protein